MATMSVPDITTSMGRTIIEDYIDEYDANGLDIMLRKMGAPQPKEIAERTIRGIQLVHNPNLKEKEAPSPVKHALPRSLWVQPLRGSIMLWEISRLMSCPGKVFRANFMCGM